MTPPLKSYSVYKSSGVKELGDVPDHWNVWRLGQIGKLSKGSGGSKEDEVPVGVPCVRYGDLYTTHDCFIGESRSFVSAKKAKAYTAIRFGDVLFAASGETIDEIGKSAVNLIRGEACCGGDVIVLRPALLADPRYMGYVTDCSPTVAQKASRGRGITVKHIYADQLKCVVLALPPLPEQTAIVRFLDHADRRIRRYIRTKQKLIALLEEQKQAIIHQAVTGQIDIRTGQPYPAYKPSGVAWLRDVPGHWERRRLKTLLKPIDRRSLTGRETLLSLRRDYGVVVYADHFSHPSQSASLIGFKIVQEGQLVVNRLQANNGLIFCSTLNGLVSPDYSVFNARLPVQMKFLSELCRTSPYRAHFRRRSTGLGTGTAGFLRLYDDKFLDTLVFIPALPEQTAILNFVERSAASSDDTMDHARGQIDLLQEYRTRLIADVVTGKLDIRESAAALPEVDPLAAEDDLGSTFDTGAGPDLDEIDATLEEAEA